MSFNFVSRATYNPITLAALIIVACCLPLHCEGDVSFENATAKGKDGSIELDLSLNASVRHGDNITIFHRCINEETGSVVAKGPIYAGETYNCTIFGIVTDHNLEKITTKEFVSQTGQQLM